MTQDFAIIAGQGALPRLLKAFHPKAHVFGFEGVETEVECDERFELNKLGELFSGLSRYGIKNVTLSGAMSRPAFDPDAMDSFTQNILPNLAAAMGQGDDVALRFIIKMFENEGQHVVGLADICPQLLAQEGQLGAHAPQEHHWADYEMGRKVLAQLDPMDIGQGLVVEGGHVLGIETLQGTDAMLTFVENTEARHRKKKGGVLIKHPKSGQDLRVDIPAIGPRTVANIDKAGLAGIFVMANKTVILDPEAVSNAADEAGIFVYAVSEGK
jgi:DUF1009 family protein